MAASIFYYFPHAHIGFCFHFSLYLFHSLSEDWLSLLILLLTIVNGYPKISYICSQFKLPTEAVFKMSVGLEMIGHLGAAESLRRAVGRANSQMNASINSDSKLCFQQCVLSIPCKVDTSAMLNSHFPQL